MENEVIFNIGGHTFNFFKAHMIMYIERVRWSKDDQYILIVGIPKGKNAGIYPLTIFLGTDEKKAKDARCDFYEWWVKSLEFHATEKIIKQ